MSGEEEEEEILIDDDDDDEETTSQNKRNEIADNVTLLNYHSHVITDHDYLTLEHNEYLNDAIINFYLFWLLQNKVELQDKELIHIFSSHFYSRLTSFSSKKHRKASNSEFESSKAERAYSRVKRWTKKIDIFSKKLLIFPICEDSHWFMILIANPDYNNKDKTRFETKDTFIVVYDSFGESHSSTVKLLRMYLQFEYLERKKKLCSFGSQFIQTLFPRIPKQNNTSDCGVFLLHYAEKILQQISNSKAYFSSFSLNFDLGFPDKEIFIKRTEIANCIEELARQSSDKKLIHPSAFPSLRSFDPCGKNRRDIYSSYSTAGKSEENKYDSMGRYKGHSKCEMTANSTVTSLFDDLTEKEKKKKILFEPCTFDPVPKKRFKLV